VHYPRALPFLPAYARLRATRDTYPKAAAAQDEILSLPLYPELPDHSIREVCQLIRDFYARADQA